MTKSKLRNDSKLSRYKKSTIDIDDPARLSPRNDTRDPARGQALWDFTTTLIEEKIQGMDKGSKAKDGDQVVIFPTA